MANPGVVSLEVPHNTANISSKECIQPPAEAAIPEQPLRILALDTQGICSQLFSKQLSTHLNFGTVTHPYIIAATLGPDRIHTKLECNEKMRNLWDERVAQAPPRVANMTYNIATEKFLREADRLEQKVGLRVN